MTNDTARILASCLDAIEQQGRSPEECMAQHPDQRLTLSELLPVAQTLRSAPAVIPSLDFRMDARQRLLVRLPVRRSRRATRVPKRVMSVQVGLMLLMVVTLAASVVTASAQALPNDPYISRGFLLLSEALLRQQEYPAAEETLNLLAKRNLTPELDWQRLDLLTRLQLADLQPDKALQSVTNLLALTTSAGLRERQPQAVALHGAALQKANRPPAALAVYEQNLAEGLPAEQRRQALLKIVELSLAQDQMSQAVQRLEKFLGENPKDPLSDLACLTLGELHLKAFYLPAPTNRVTVSSAKHVPRHRSRERSSFVSREGGSADVLSTETRAPRRRPFPRIRQASRITRSR